MSASLQVSLYHLHHTFYKKNPSTRIMRSSVRIVGVPQKP